jgi:hypothetical protein
MALRRNNPGVPGIDQQGKQEKPAAQSDRGAQFERARKIRLVSGQLSERLFRDVRTIMPRQHPRR